MKACFWIPFACLAGVIVGAWGPRGEIRAMKELARTEKARPRSAASEGFRTFAGFVNIPSEAKRPRRPRGEAKPLFTGSTNRVVQRASASASAAATNDTTAAGGEKPSGRRTAPDDLRARIEEAKELWLTRVALARANWKAKLKVPPADEARFDALLDEMNVQLFDSVQALADLVAEKGRVTPELGLRLVGDATTIMVETYEKIGSCVPPEMRGTVAEMPMTDFIDPGVAEPLIPVQDKFENFPGPHRR